MERFATEAHESIAFVWFFEVASPTYAWVDPSATRYAFDNSGLASLKFDFDQKKKWAIENKGKKYKREAIEMGGNLKFGPYKCDRPIFSLKDLNCSYKLK